jgi:hypothetical protein
VGDFVGAVVVGVGVGDFVGAAVGVGVGGVARRSTCWKRMRVADPK